MLDYNKANMASHSLEQLQGVKMLVERDGVVIARLKRLNVSSRLKNLSTRLANREEREEMGSDLGSQIADLFPLHVVLDLLRVDLHNYTANSLYSLGAPTTSNGGSNGIELWNDENATITLVNSTSLDSTLPGSRSGNVKTVPHTISIGATDTYTRVLYCDGARLKLWNSAPLGFETPISSDLKCWNISSIRIETGSSVITQGGRSAWEIEEVAGSLVLLVITDKRLRSPVIAHYNRSTCALESVAAADVNSARLQILMDFLRQKLRTEASEILAPLLEHRDHFVRWQCAREMLASNLDTALPHVKAMVDDPHPQVVSAVKKTLEMIKE